MSPSTSRSPATKARPTPSSFGDQINRRSASADLTWITPTGSAGPNELPSQKSKRIVSLPPSIAVIKGATAAAAPVGGPVDVGSVCRACAPDTDEDARFQSAAPFGSARRRRVDGVVLPAS